MTDTTSTTPVASIQPSQGSTLAAYDVHQPLPYPFHINADGTVARQDVWKGDPASLAGFQRDVDVQEVEIFDFQWLADLDQADRVIGMFPVFIRADGGLYTDTRPVSGVSVTEGASA